jgi:hypothetical protein
MSTLDERLGEIRARLDAATPGPWGRIISRGFQETPQSPDKAVDTICASGMVYHDTDNNRSKVFADSELIANAPTDIARLLQALELCRRQRDHWTRDATRSDYDDAALLEILRGVDSEQA